MRTRVRLDRWSRGSARAVVGDAPATNRTPTAEEQFGIPAPALELHEALRTSHGVLIASPEYNANVSPLLSNALAWTSRVQTHGAGTVHLAFRYSPLIALPQVAGTPTRRARAPHDAVHCECSPSLRRKWSAPRRTQPTHCCADGRPAAYRGRAQSLTSPLREQVKTETV